MLRIAFFKDWDAPKPFTSSLNHNITSVKLSDRISTEQMWFLMAVSPHVPSLLMSREST